MYGTKNKNTEGIGIAILISIPGNIIATSIHSCCSIGIIEPIIRKFCLFDGYRVSVIDLRLLVEKIRLGSLSIPLLLEYNMISNLEFHHYHFCITYCLCSSALFFCCKDRNMLVDFPIEIWCFRFFGRIMHRKLLSSLHPIHEWRKFTMLAFLIILDMTYIILRYW